MGKGRRSGDEPSLPGHWVGGGVGAKDDQWKTILIHHRPVDRAGYLQAGHKRSIQLPEGAEEPLHPILWPCIGGHIGDH